MPYAVHPPLPTPPPSVTAPALPRLRAARRASAGDVLLARMIASLRAEAAPALVVELPPPWPRRAGP